jgi:hypothetical protein
MGPVKGGKVRIRFCMGCIKKGHEATEGNKLCGRECTAVGEDGKLQHDCTDMHRVGEATAKKCEGCQKKRPSHGLPAADGQAKAIARWCGPCAKIHAPKALNVVSKRCEDCQVVQPHFGLPPRKKARWCGSCAKAHPGAVNATRSKCEDCNQFVPSVGLAIDKKPRWCTGCARAHKDEGIVQIGRILCEHCKDKHASFGLASEGKKRWCRTCAIVHHPTATNIGSNHKKCEICEQKVRGAPAVARVGHGHWAGHGAGYGVRGTGAGCRA